MSIIVKKTKKRLSSHAGLLVARKVSEALGTRELMDSSLPRLNSGTSRSYKKFSDLMLSLIAGADCIDDLEKLGNDEGFKEICDGKVYTPKAYGDFLRSFSKEGILAFQEAVMRFGFLIHRRIYPNDRLFFFDVDSTPNYQYGKKMEGVACNYQKRECLDTLDVFDGNGLQYFIDVRPGNTFTSRGSEDVIHRLMSIFYEYKDRWKKNWRACFRGDRGFYNVGFVNACIAKNADVIVGVRQDEHHFPRIINQVHNWRRTDLENPDRIKFYDGREVEIGTTNYRPTGYARRLRYVVMRAKRPLDPMFPEYVTYDYYAFATTYSEQLMADEEVIFCYRERGQAENYVKENKYGLDMKHYPCLKLDANRVYALICAFSYNIMRLMSLAHDRSKPILSKNIRFRWINIPSLVARTGGNVIFRFMEPHYKEMTRWFELIHNLQFGIA